MIYLNKKQDGYRIGRDQDPAIEYNITIILSRVEDHPIVGECLDSRWLRLNKTLSKSFDKKRKVLSDLPDDQEKEFCSRTRPPLHSLVDVSNAVIVEYDRRRIK